MTSAASARTAQSDPPNRVGIAGQVRQSNYPANGHLGRGDDGPTLVCVPPLDFRIACGNLGIGRGLEQPSDSESCSGLEQRSDSQPCSGLEQPRDSSSASRGSSESSTVSAHMEKWRQFDLNRKRAYMDVPPPLRPADLRHLPYNPEVPPPPGLSPPATLIAKPAATSEQQPPPKKKQENLVAVSHT